MWSPNPIQKETFTIWLTLTELGLLQSLMLSLNHWGRLGTQIGVQLFRVWILSFLQKDKLCMITKEGSFCNKKALRKQVHKARQQNNNKKLLCLLVGKELLNLLMVSGYWDVVIIWYFQRFDNYVIFNSITEYVIWQYTYF